MAATLNRVAARQMRFAQCKDNYTQLN